jgi:O-antigen/teichoic acid export membrane protein
VIDFLYDSRYWQAGDMARILSFSLVFARFGVFTTAYLALGRSELTALVSTVRLVVLLVLMLAGYAFFGFPGALWAIALYQGACVPLIFYLNHTLKINDWRYEFFTLAGWPVGYVCGLLIIRSIQIVGGV